LCKREMLDDIIANQRKLHPVSSLDCDQFGFVCRRFIEQSKKHPGRPLFSEDDSDDPGNRCKLPYRHVILMIPCASAGRRSRSSWPYSVT